MGLFISKQPTDCARQRQDLLSAPSCETRDIGYQALPPGIAKNVARGKPLPPGIAKKTLPASMINDLPYYPGYEWRAVGDDLVLVALSTAIVTAVINGVFD